MFHFLKNIFKAKPKFVIKDFSSIAVDMHSHLAPGIDDGSKSPEESLTILTRLKELGYKKMITTPHIMSGGYDNTSEIIKHTCQELQSFLSEKNFEIELDYSSEYYLDGHFDKLLKAKDLLPFGNNYILFELSYMFKPNNLEHAIFDMQLENYRPILAHPERYNYLIDNDLKKFKQIKNSGVFFQLNLFSLVGAYGPQSQKCAEMLIKENMIDFVGTDIHNITQLNYFDALLHNEHLFHLIEKDTLLNKTLLS